MSDSHNTGHGGHHGGGGGHEIDEPPTKELFNIVWGLGAVTLLSLVTCVQLFNNQQHDLLAERGKEASFVLEQYQSEMDAVIKGSGELSFKDTNGKEVKQRFVPLAVARELVLSKPEGLHAAAPPPGWQHPDDIAAGGQAGGAAPTPAPPVPVPVPAPGDAVVPVPGDAVVPAPGDAAGAVVPGAAPGAPAVPGAAPGAPAPEPGAAVPGAAAPGVPAPAPAPAPGAAPPAAAPPAAGAPHDHPPGEHH
jgi:hypothetical protein